MAVGRSNSEGVTFGGELWTDAHGSAEVELAHYLSDRSISYTYEIRPMRAPRGVSVAAEVVSGRLRITSNAPHLKVAWRVTASSRKRVEEERR